MNLKPYPAYKDSGVEWLGTIPDGWMAALLKRGYDVCLGKMLQPEAKSEDDELLPYLRAANIKWGNVDLSDVKEMWISKSEQKSLLLKKGDALVSEGGDVGRTSIWNGELDICYFQNSVNRVRSRKGNSNRFLYYWIFAVKEKGFIDILCNKSTISHFTAEKVQALPVAFPSESEQQAIATFLDRETAKLDTLISKQERLIELLQEKRQAVISHAVIKGLDPDVPMKDSGIEWLGEVPEHWVVRKLKYGLRLLSDKSGERENTVGLENIEGWSGKFIETDSEFEGDGIKFNKGDILFGKLRPYLAKVYLAEFSGEAVGDFHVMRPQSDVIGRFAQYQMLNRDFISIVDGSTFGAKMPRASWEFVGSMLVTIPPLAEQEKIAKYLDEQTKTIELLINKARQSIDLAKEHRTALISAAVTGKIDVREAA